MPQPKIPDGRTVRQFWESSSTEVENRTEVNDNFKLLWSMVVKIMTLFETAKKENNLIDWKMAFLL